MSLETYLDTCIAEFQNFLNENKFEFEDSETSTFAIYKLYQNHDIKIKFTNDRGVIEIELNSKKPFFINSNEIIRRLKNTEKPYQYNLTETNQFFSENYESLVSFLKSSNY